MHSVIAVAFRSEEKGPIQISGVISTLSVQSLVNIHQEIL